MVGLIWFVQVVHYPLFASVEADQFETYQTLHMRRTAWIVGVFMPAEAITGLWLLADRPPSVSSEVAALGAVMIVLLWLATAFWQAPIHGRLVKAFDSRLHQNLVRSNWLRTGLWSARGLLFGFMLAQLA